MSQTRIQFNAATTYRALLSLLIVFAAALAGCNGSSGLLTSLGLPWDTGALDGTDSGDSFLGPLEASEFEVAGAPACAQVGAPASATHLEMFEALNEYREKNGLEPLIYSQTLEAAADAQALDLWVRNFFDHTNPDGLGPADRALREGFCHRYVGENIAAGQFTVEHVMQAWEDSPSHNENMLEANYVYVGMGHSTDGRGRQYWAQVFAFDVP